MSQQQQKQAVRPTAAGMLVGIVRDEGAMALFRGWLPAFTRLGPQTILTFIFLEQLRAAIIN
jgi:dicarboxylate transporter 10